MIKIDIKHGDGEITVKGYEDEIIAELVCLLVELDGNFNKEFMEAVAEFLDCKGVS